MTTPENTPEKTPSEEPTTLIRDDETLVHPTDPSPETTVIDTEVSDTEPVEDQPVDNEPLDNELIEDQPVKDELIDNEPIEDDDEPLEPSFAPSSPPAFTYGSPGNTPPVTASYPAASAGPVTAAYPATSYPAEAPPARDVRMRTVVFGLVLLVIAGSVLVDLLTDVPVHAGGVLLALMVGGGLLLVAGARRT